jgi:mannitol/fructose-specific phosphotransferase system IIA component
MLKLEQRNVQLHASASNKLEAINIVGELLVSAENIKPGYI